MKIEKELRRLLFQLEEMRDRLEGSAVVDEIEEAVWGIAEKYNLKLK